METVSPPLAPILPPADPTYNRYNKYRGYPGPTMDEEQFDVGQPCRYHHVEQLPKGVNDGGQTQSSITQSVSASYLAFDIVIDLLDGQTLLFRQRPLVIGGGFQDDPTQAVHKSLDPGMTIL